MRPFFMGIGLSMFWAAASFAAAPVEIVFQSVTVSSETQLTSTYGSESSYQRTTRTSPIIGHAQESAVAEATLAGVLERADTKFILSPDLTVPSPRVEMTALLGAASITPSEPSPANVTTSASANVSLSLTLQVTRPMRLVISASTEVTGSFGGQMSYWLTANYGVSVLTSTISLSRSGTNYAVTTLGAGTYGLSFNASAQGTGQIDITPEGEFVNLPSGTNTVGLQLEFEPLPDDTTGQPRLFIHQKSDGRFTIELTELTPGKYYQLEKATSLDAPNWSQLRSFQATSSSVSVTENNSLNTGTSFYRVVGFQ